MATLDEIINNRKEKIKYIESFGREPYPIKTNRTHNIKKVIDNFDELSKEAKEICLVGRIRTLRIHGGLSFIDFQDGGGTFQAVFMKDRLGEKGYEYFKETFDIGDFIELKGTLFVTKRGEKTLEVSDFQILAKSIRPLPEKWHGLKDVEERYRKRYLDLIFSDEIKQNFIKRSKIISSIRSFLEENGFMEVETPTLQVQYGGARAKPFTTHLNAYDLDMFLRISPELYLKRLLVGGFEKVFEIGKCFRNEGVDKSHNPDFTMLEFYAAYMDYIELMKLTEKLFDRILKDVFKTNIVKIGENEVNFEGPWERIEFFALLEKYTGIKYEEINEEGLFKKAKELGVEIPKGADKANIADEIYKKYCRPNIINPTFVIHYPKGFQPLAKGFNGVDKLANFQLLIAGMEVVNAFSEQNDPIEQERVLKSQEKLFKEGFEEAQRSDEEFIEALEYGMPPAAGFGMGLDRLVMLLTNSSALREIILFPIMKPKE
ncbi:MAG: lysine--tRNA ligase [Candidatus Pacebacteria bacterium]|nr:lysine--tRNA ligase [Candidatus Paceibacterota bacterium]